jgi:hypothetical protein
MTAAARNAKYMDTELSLTQAKSLLYQDQAALSLLQHLLRHTEHAMKM